MSVTTPRKPVLTHLQSIGGDGQLHKALFKLKQQQQKSIESARLGNVRDLWQQKIRNLILIEGRYIIMNMTSRINQEQCVGSR